MNACGSCGLVSFELLLHPRMLPHSYNMRHFNFKCVVSIWAHRVIAVRKFLNSLLFLTKPMYQEYRENNKFDTN